jgi:Polyketide cyclase / dehydrase and lipid transport
MHTVTDAVECGADVAAMLAVLGDPTRLPQWAPGFADQVHGDHASGWTAVRDGRAFDIVVAVNERAGTVDYLRRLAPDRMGGAYLRVIPAPDGGTVITMTLPLLDGVPGADTRATLRAELAALVLLGAPH